MRQGRLYLIRTMSLFKEEEQDEKANIVVETDSTSVTIRCPEN